METTTASVFRRLLTYIKPYKGRFAVALAAMTIYGASDGALPFLIKVILDKIFGEHQEHWLIPLAAGLVLFACVRGYFGFIQKYYSACVGLDIVKDIRNDINRHLLRMSPAFFSQHQTGSLISRITNDSLLVRMALTDAVASLIRDSIRIVALVGAAIYLDPVLALIALVGFPIGFYPVIRFGRRVRKLSKTGQDQFGGLTSVLQETIIGHKVVQSFSMQPYEVERFNTENESLTDTLKKSEKYGALSGPTNETVASLAIAATILYGGFSVIGGVRTQGDFLAFITSMFLLYEPVKKLSRLNNLIQNGVAASERIFEVLDAEPDIIESPDAKPLDLSERTGIQYDGVWFAYEKGEREGSEEWVLRDINLEVGAGEMLALVGMSGGGKSTIADLLPRFYDPLKGAIRIAGQDLREVQLESLRETIATVGQHTFLFNESVFNNIRYGRPTATDEEVYAAAKAANAHVFIEKMPRGYGTVIGEQGLRLSGGERQRIAIARALLKDAPILVLDEATAALDSESELLVQEAIDRLMQGRTVMVIAHRLATVRRANTIAVIVDGRVVESGTHEELLSKRGEYAKLHSIQSAEAPRESSRLSSFG
ncbi:MAG: ATP-binding cassette domain-containing protein [Bdellovibrionales bacterium]|nr:ATP-binding cassette domain-containing protein [Bdellovibrionales bacterium]